MNEQTQQQEQAAPVDWQAIARQRERELKTVGEARHRAEQERDHLAAAASPADVAVRAIQLMQETGRERDAALAAHREVQAALDRVRTIVDGPSALDWRARIREAIDQVEELS